MHGVRRSYGHIGKADRVMSLIKIERRVFSRVFREPSRFGDMADPIFTPVKYRRRIRRLLHKTINV